MKTGIQTVKLLSWIILNDHCKSTNNTIHPPIHLFFHTPGNRGPHYTGNQNYEPLRVYKLLHKQVQILKPAIMLNSSDFSHMGARPQSAILPRMTCNKYFLAALINVHIWQSKSPVFVILNRALKKGRFSDRTTS